MYCNTCSSKQCCHAPTHSLPHNTHTLAIQVKWHRILKNNRFIASFPRCKLCAMWYIHFYNKVNLRRQKKKKKKKEKKKTKNYWKLHGSSGEMGGGAWNWGSQPLQKSPHPQSALFCRESKAGTAPPTPSLRLKRAVTVVRGPERGRAEGVTGSSRPRAFWRGCPVSLGEQPRRWWSLSGDARPAPRWLPHSHSWTAGGRRGQQCHQSGSAWIPTSTPPAQAAHR